MQRSESFRSEVFKDETLDRDASFRTCRCGFHKHDHIHVVPKCKYKWHAILRLLIGATAYPYEVRYVCERCNETIETTRDIEVLKTHV